MDADIEEPPAKKRKTFELDIEKIQHIMKCGVCLDYLSPDSVCCTNGHYICKSCYNKLKYNSYSNTCCPQCKTNFTNVKPRILMDIFDSLEYEVKCSHEKCQKEVLIKNYWEHKNNCPYREYKCDFTNCRYIHTDNMDELIKHYNEKHYFIESSVDSKHSKENISVFPILIKHLYERSQRYIFKLNDDYCVTLETLNCQDLVGEYLKNKCKKFSLFLFSLVTIGHYTENKKICYEIRSECSPSLHIGHLTKDKMTSFTMNVGSHKVFYYVGDKDKKEPYVLIEFRVEDLID